MGVKRSWPLLVPPTLALAGSKGNLTGWWPSQVYFRRRKKLKQMRMDLKCAELPQFLKY